MTREDKLALGGGVVFFTLLIVWGWSQGAFAKPPDPGPEPKLPPKPTPDSPIKPPQAPVEPEAPERIIEHGTVPPVDVPTWLLEGGAPPSGREHLAWYSYMRAGVKHWIRIEGEHDVDSAPASTGHQHPHGWIWWAVYADNTPIAMARAFKGEQASFVEDPDALLPIDSSMDAAAREAAAWIDGQG